MSRDWEKLQQQPTDATKKQFDASLDVVKAIVGGVGTIATIGGGVFVLWNLRLTQTRLITERFSKAVEQLGSDKIEVRLGGIYALERIAYDSNRDHWTIMEVLTSFIQEKSPIPTEEQIRVKAYELWQNSNGSGTEQEHWTQAIKALTGERVTKDVQAALTVIGRRQKKDPPDKYLDLSGANLQGAKLNNANLQQADLNRANLQAADLNYANLQQAILLATDLRNTKGLTNPQLGGKQPPLLCHVALPESFLDKDKLKDRDCDRLPQELLKRYPQILKDIETVKKYVDKTRQKQWE